MNLQAKWQTGGSGTRQHLYTPEETKRGTFVLTSETLRQLANGSMKFLCGSTLCNKSAKSPPTEGCKASQMLNAFKKKKKRKELFLMWGMGHGRIKHFKGCAILGSCWKGSRGIPLLSPGLIVFHCGRDMRTQFRASKCFSTSWEKPLKTRVPRSMP